MYAPGGVELLVWIKAVLLAVPDPVSVTEPGFMKHVEAGGAPLQESATVPKNSPTVT